MKNIAVFIVLLCMGKVCTAQHNFRAIVKDADSKRALHKATAVFTGLNKVAVADSNGVILISGIPDGKQEVVFQFVGYGEQSMTLVFPLAGEELEVLLEPMEEEDMEDVVVTSTRSSRTIQHIPTRVELIAGEELDEKGNMKPGDIRMMLNESTGIQTQQVSATSANASIRIQGLDGRYTQILRDGFPLYAGFSGGLGLLQTPPLDLKQVEVIKGASSTLYGGGAIAGLVNLISKVPAQERELRFLTNATSAGGLDLSGFYGQRFSKAGVTVFASRNTSRAYDPSTTGFTAIPQTQRYTVNPKLFLYFSPRTTMNVGVNTTFEDRLGGDIQYIKGNGDSQHSYFEKNKSTRLSSQLALEHTLTENVRLTLKNSVSVFDRAITIPGYVFDGKQLSSYSELAYNHNREKADWVAGFNFYTDKFTEKVRDAFPQRNYELNTGGAFVQNSWRPADWLQTELGARADYVTDYGWIFLPRVSALFKISPQLTSRLGGGMGYKTPTIFTEEAERIQFRSVLPVSFESNSLEKSHGLNFDVNYKTSLSQQLKLSVNQLFFYTRIKNPLQLNSVSGSFYQLLNVTGGHIDTKGWETNIKLSYEDIKLFIGYTYTDAQLTANGVKTVNPLTARHRLNNVLMYEVEDQWKIGLEGYYYSGQTLTDGATGKPYWIFGFMAEKLWERFSLFVNFENFTDTRQTKSDTIYTGSVSKPVFRDIYMPLDGFVVNGGLKLKL